MVGLYFLSTQLYYNPVVKQSYFEVPREGIMLIKNCIWQWTFYKSYLFCTSYKQVYVTIHFYHSIYAFHSVLSYSITRWHFAQRGLVAYLTVNNCTPFKNLYSPDPFYAGKFFCPYSTPKNFYNRHSGRYAQFVSYPFRWLPVVKVSTIGTALSHMAQLVLSSASLRVRAKDEGRTQDATRRRHLLWLLRARDSNNTDNKSDLQHPRPRLRYCKLSVRHCLSTSARVFCRRLIWASPKTNRRPVSPIKESEGVESRAVNVIITNHYNVSISSGWKPKMYWLV